MRCECIAPVNDEGRFAEFITRDGQDILIHSKHLSPGRGADQVDVFYLFYDYVNELEEQKLDTESERLADLILKAQEIQTDTGYKELKNANQRSIWLLAKYSITGRDATDIQELLKPEMAALLGGP